MTNRLNTSEIDAIDDALSRLASEGGSYESARAKIRARRYRRRSRVAKQRKASTISQHQRELLRLLRLGDFVFDGARGIWRFGTRRIANPAVADMVDRGLVMRCGDRVTLTPPVVEPTTIAPELRWLYEVGKKAAGRPLDGVEHNAMPNAKATTKDERP